MSRDAVSGGRPVRLEIHISYSCGNDCLFCSEKNRLAKFRGQDLSAPEIVRVLRQKRAAGFTHVTFTGGEPSLPGTLPAALGAARALGYKTCVTTNGSAFAAPEFARLAVPLLDEAMVSCHGDGAALHDGLTRRPGSFAAVQAAIRNIGAFGGGRVFLMVNTVLSRRNERRLPQILRLVSAPGVVRHFLVSFPAPEGAACLDYAGLVPDLDRLSASVPRLLAAARKKDIALRFFGVPACVLGGHWELSNDLHYSPRLTVERGAGGGAGLKETVSRRPTRRRLFLPSCRSCALRGGCGGIFRRYLEYFPERAGLFKPLPGTAGRPR